MNETLLIYCLIMLASTLVSSISQVILKKAAGRTYESRIREYLNAPVVFAYALFFAATLMTVFAYRVVPLSLGAALEATSYVYVTAFGVLFFKEKVGARKLGALALIIAGIIVYAISM